MPSRRIAVEDAHLDSLACFSDEQVAQVAAGAVVAKDVILQMDVVPGIGDGFAQRIHLGTSVGVGGDATPVERHSLYGVDE